MSDTPRTDEAMRSLLELTKEALHDATREFFRPLVSLWSWFRRTK